MICRYKQYIHATTILKCWLIFKTTSIVKPDWNFDLRIFSVNWHWTGSNWLLKEIILVSTLNQVYSYQMKFCEELWNEIWGCILHKRALYHCMKRIYQMHPYITFAYRKTMFKTMFIFLAKNFQNTVLRCLSQFFGLKEFFDTLAKIN